MSDPSAAWWASSMPYRAPVTAAATSEAGGAAGTGLAAAETTLAIGFKSTEDARDDEVDVEEDKRVRRRVVAARGLAPAIPALCILATAAVADSFANLCAPRPLLPSSSAVPRMNGFLVAHFPFPSTIPARFDALPCPSSRLFHRQGTWKTAAP